MHETYHHCLFYNVRILYVGRGEKMKNEITEKLELFMQNLRCEDMSRETLVHLDSCRIESERLAELEEEYRQTMIELEDSSRVVFVSYNHQIQKNGF